MSDRECQEGSDRDKKREKEKGTTISFLRAENIWGEREGVLHTITYQEIDMIFVNINHFKSVYNCHKICKQICLCQAIKSDSLKEKSNVMSILEMGNGAHCLMGKFSYEMFRTRPDIRNV